MFSIWCPKTFLCSSSYQPLQPHPSFCWKASPNYGIPTSVFDVGIVHIGWRPLLLFGTCTWHHCVVLVFLFTLVTSLRFSFSSIFTFLPLEPKFLNRTKFFVFIHNIGNRKYRYVEQFFVTVTTVVRLHNTCTMVLPIFLSFTHCRLIRVEIHTSFL